MVDQRRRKLGKVIQFCWLRNYVKHLGKFKEFFKYVRELYWARDSVKYQGMQSNSVKILKNSLGRGKSENSIKVTECF